MQGLQLIWFRRVIVFLKYQELALSCKKALYFEHYLSLNVGKVNKMRSNLHLAWLAEAISEHFQNPGILGKAVVINKDGRL